MPEAGFAQAFLLEASCRLEVIVNQWFSAAKLEAPSRFTETCSAVWWCSLFGQQPYVHKRQSAHSIPVQRSA